jgi:hypothetical protein
LLARVRRFFSAHPLLFLFLLAPQVEYLTGSSQLSWLIGNPPLFFGFLLQNLGSYGLAVILTREAQIRWQKGWASIILLGSAYGILNEGIGAATLFNPDASAFGVLGSYGRWLGVNWVWATGLVMLVHPLFSVSLPILQHRLALPETRGRSLIGNRGLALAILGLGIDALGTLLFVGTIRHFFAGPILWIGSCAAMASLVVAAYIVPRELLQPKAVKQQVRPLSFFLLGVVFIWSVTLGGDFLVNLTVPPILVAFFLIAIGGLALIWVLRNVGQIRNQHHLVALAAGLVASLIPMGFFGQLGTGIGLLPVVAVDLLGALFFTRLWRKYNYEPLREEK